MPRYQLTLPASIPRKHLMVTRQTLRAPDPETARQIAAKGCGIEGAAVWLTDAEIVELE